MDETPKSEPKSDAQRLIELLDRPDSVAHLMDERFIKEQFAWQNRALKWIAGLSTAGLIAGATAAMNDHLTLRDTVKEVSRMQEVQGGLVKRNWAMWYAGKFDEKRPDLNR